MVDAFHAVIAAIGIRVAREFLVEAVTAIDVIFRVFADIARLTVPSRSAGDSAIAESLIFVIVDAKIICCVALSTRGVVIAGFADITLGATRLAMTACNVVMLALVVHALPTVSTVGVRNAFRLIELAAFFDVAAFRIKVFVTVRTHLVLVVPVGMVLGNTEFAQRILINAIVVTPHRYPRVANDIGFTVFATIVGPA